MYTFTVLLALLVASGATMTSDETPTSFLRTDVLCSPNQSLCGSDKCFDPATQKCCVTSGGRFGTCPAGADCCGNMCCDHGHVCANSFDGLRCWPTNPRREIAGANENITMTTTMTESVSRIVTGRAVTTYSLSGGVSVGLVPSRNATPKQSNTGKRLSLSWLLCVASIFSVCAIANVHLDTVPFEVGMADERATVIPLFAKSQKQELDELSEKKGGGGHGGGGHGGGHGGGRGGGSRGVGAVAGGGGHKSNAVRAFGGILGLPGIGYTGLLLSVGVAGLLWYW